MKKQIITAFLIPFLLLNFTGCYSTSYISVSDFQKNPSRGDINIFTDKGESYFFKSDRYRIKNDTLIAVKDTIGNLTNPAKLTKVPFNEITAVKTETLNAGTTLFLLVGIAATVYLIIGAFALNSVHDHLFEGGSW